MKLMKHITIALVLCAIPAMAFGQTVSCDDCTHAVSYYLGGGGLIAEADIADDDDETMVTYVASCGGVTRTGELMANDDGIVTMLFAGVTACEATKAGSLQLGPVKDGGWFWLTDADNSAVGSLVVADLKGYVTTDPTDPGSDDITMTAGSGAVFVKQASTGRVGILPTILASAPVAALRPCGYNTGGTAAAPSYSRRTSGCAMGDGGTITLATTYDGYRGVTAQLANKGSITRPAGDATASVVIDLWGNHSGHFTTSADDNARLGNPAVGPTASDTNRGNRLTGVTYTGTQGTGGAPGGSPLGTTDAVAGITLDTTTTTDTVIVKVVADTSYCSKTNNHTATVNIVAVITEDGAALVTPSVKRNAASGVAGGITFNVMCPSGAAANQGQELVPDNPFPTDR